MRKLRASDRERQRSIARHSVIPVLILSVSVIAAMIVAGLVIARATRGAAMEAERQRVIEALEGEKLRAVLDAERAVAAGLVRGAEPAAIRVSADWARRRSDAPIIVARIDGQIRHSAPSPAQLSIGTHRLLADAIAAVRLRGDAGEFLPRGTQAGFTLLDDRLTILTVTTAEGLEPDTVVVTASAIEAAVVERIASLAAITQLARTGPDDMPLLTLQDFRSARSTIGLHWVGLDSSADPVQRASLIGALGMLIMIVYGLLVYSHVRNKAGEILLQAAEARHRAGHDALTGLPNRTLFGERLDAALRRCSGEHGMALMLLDLDRFKEVNDTLGHAAGDQLIIEFGRRVHGLLRGVDTVARLGGDEFAVIQTGLRNHRDAEALARSVLSVAREPFLLSGASVEIGVSVGIALAPQNARETFALTRAADAALYRAKSEGRNRFSFYEDELDELEKMRKLVEDELRGAIEADQLVLHYQPQFSADGGDLIAVEALVRWNHPKIGMIPPSIFVSAAEERGLVVPLGEWVLRRACKDAKRWPGLKIAVNISPMQFKHRDFVAGVLREIEVSGIEPERLELELTEGVLIDDADEAERAMSELRSHGIRLALDDFGTGYSSLIYLRRFAFDKIKMDKSFLDSLEATGESAILVHSVVHLGRALGLEVLAEGVETEDQHRFLQAVGCHAMQGYLFSKPISPDDLDRLWAAAAKSAKVKRQAA